MADKKDLNTIGYAIMGAVFGPFAIPFILLAKEKKEVKSNE